MAPPPPPPPGPPALPVNLPDLSNSSGQQRSMLLQSIRQGTKLKKTVTIDKSGPFITGKVAGVSKTDGSDNESSRNVSSNSKMSKQISINGKPSGLGNLFAGGVPKLKPVNWTVGPSLNSNKESLTLKLSDSKTRGPPPQPPPGSQKPIISSSASDSILTLTYSSSNITTSRINNECLLLSNKPNTGGYGKPNLAPKPPTVKETLLSQGKFNNEDSQTGFSDNFGCSQNILSNCQGKPSPPPKKITLNNRLGINRAQSMRVPKSPPVAPTTSPPFPPFHKQNLVKTKIDVLQTQDDLNGKNFTISKTGTLPHHFQKTVLPPTMPPPPTPNQRIPTRPPISKPPPPPSRPAPPPAPPLPPPPPPPHRTSPALPSMPQPRLTSGVGSCCPPPPPVRNLSVRNGFFTHQNDIENKFAHLFHKVQEFPCPGAFKNLIKNYNTRALSIAKQPAPPPPASSSMLQLNNKLWVNNTSHC